MHKFHTCLQASIETTASPDDAAFFFGDTDFFAGFALVPVAFLALPEELRVVFAMITIFA